MVKGHYFAADHILKKTHTIFYCRITQCLAGFMLTWEFRLCSKSGICPKKLKITN